MYSKKHLPYYEIEGTHSVVGEFIGKTFRAQIQEAISKRKKTIENYESYLPKSHECLEITKKYFPNLILETESTAKAADVEMIDLFFMSNREVYDPEEVWDANHITNGNNPDHCTVVAGYDNGNLVIGHNEDWSAEVIDELYVLKATIGEVTFIGLQYDVVVLGCSATMNNFGLVQCINDLYQTNKIGIPKYYLARAILEAKTLDEAEHIIRSVPRGSGFNHVLAQNGEIRNIEIAGDAIGVQSALHTPYVHTNHYLTEELKMLEKFHTKSSEERYIRATELLKPNMSIEDIKAILADSENKEYPICREDETIGSAISNPYESKSYFCYGHPCVGEFVEYKL